MDAGGGHVRVESLNSGKCLDVTGRSTADGAGVIQYRCGDGANQQFQLVTSGSYFTLRARHSGKCLTVASASATDGALLEQRTCGTGNEFLWSRT